MVGGKIGGPGRGASATSLLLTGRNTFEQTAWDSSSTVHVIGISHFFIKMYQFITWYFSWMHRWFCFITARKSLPCSSCKRYTCTSWTRCWKDGNVLDLKERSPTLTTSPSYLLPLWPGTCNIMFTEHGVHFFFNFQQKIKAEIHPQARLPQCHVLTTLLHLYMGIVFRILESTWLYKHT